MKKTLVIFFIFLNIILSQSIWQVYVVPYELPDGSYLFKDNTTTLTPMSWWKKNLTYNYDADVPHIVKVGFNHAIGSTTSWGNEKSVTGSKLFNFISTSNSSQADIRIRITNEPEYRPGAIGSGYITDWNKCYWRNNKGCCNNKYWLYYITYRRNGENNFKYTRTNVFL